MKLDFMTALLCGICLGFFVFLILLAILNTAGKKHPKISDIQPHRRKEDEQR